MCILVIYLRSIQRFSMQGKKKKKRKTFKINFQSFGPFRPVQYASSRGCFRKKNVRPQSAKQHTIVSTFSKTENIKANNYSLYQYMIQIDCE